jgi:hypothetical protein
MLRNTAKKLKLDKAKVPERLAEIVRLRLEEKWPVSKIGVKFGLSRVYVHKLLASYRQGTPYVQERVKYARMTTRQAIEQVLAQCTTDQTGACNCDRCIVFRRILRGMDKHVAYVVSHDKRYVRQKERNVC